MDLPNEIRDRVVELIPDRRELLNLLLTDRRWNACATRKLYADLQLTIPHNGRDLKALENLLASSDANFRTTSALSVLPEHVTPDTYFEEYDPMTRKYDVASRQGLDRLYQRSNDSVNILLRILLTKLPPNSLTAFDWAYDYAVEAETIITLTRQHGESLQNLSLRARKGHWRDLCALKGLHSLKMEFYLTVKAAASLIWKNRKTLRHLGIGTESRNLETTYHHDIDVVQQNFHDSEMFVYHLKTFDKNPESKTPILRLESLKIIGLDLRLILYGHSLLVGQSGGRDTCRPFIDLQHLTSLTLESCFTLGRSLNLLARSSSGNTANGDDTAKKLPALRSLTIRSENTHRLRSNALKDFLCALSPLKTLRVLFSGQGPLPGLSDILPIHGATLEVLVWEDRLGPREDLESDRIPYDEECDIMVRASDIAEYCPNLVELGITFQWHYNRGGVPTDFEGEVIENLVKLPRLKTLNIRNLPRLIHHGTLQPAPFIESLAHTIAQDLLYAHDSDGPPPLRVIGLGALTYRDVHDGTVVKGATVLEEFLRLRVYAVEYVKNIRGDRVPLLTMVANGYPGNIGSDVSEDLSVFEPYWLG